MTAPTIAGTGNGSQQDTSNATPAGALFGVPKYGTQRRFVPDNGNANVGAIPSGVSQVNLPTTKLDQLDIINGIQIAVQYTGTWTNTGSGLTHSPFFPANIVQQITFKLQAAYNSFNLTGPLAAIKQVFRPMYGAKQHGQDAQSGFVTLGNSAPTFGSAYNGTFNIDVPLAIKFDEFFNLSPTGDPLNKVYDTWVTPFFMAAQARSVVPTVTIAPQLTTGDLLGGPVSRGSGDTTSTYTNNTWSSQFSRDGWWTANSPVANPPQYPWIYTNDYFTQPTSGQGQVGVLIQNTGVSVGQVLSLYGFVWDPAAASGLGAIVPFSSITEFELITGGSLQNKVYSPQTLQYIMTQKYGHAAMAGLPSGVFILDFALDDEGAYLSNADAINTYLVNGVQLNIYFKSGTIPSSTATVYMGVEALKLATS